MEKLIPRFEFLMDHYLIHHPLWKDDGQTANLRKTWSFCWTSLYCVGLYHTRFLWDSWKFLAATRQNMEKFKNVTTFSRHYQEAPISIYFMIRSVQYNKIHYTVVQYDTVWYATKCKIWKISSPDSTILQNMVRHNMVQYDKVQKYNLEGYCTV